jgi:aminoglycoside 2'-N-acetyltransferase I
MSDGSKVELGRTRLRRLATEELSTAEVAAIRKLLRAAFASDGGGFTEDDWGHSIGGIHFVLDIDRDVVAHASVVERVIRVDDRPLRSGYVEAVATLAARQREGFGSRVMEDVASYIKERFELGVLGTGRHHFYEHLGWRTWTGPSSVIRSAGMQRTPDDDGYIMVLSTPSSPLFDLTAAISCEWRPGDVW